MEKDERKAIIESFLDWSPILTGTVTAILTRVVTKSSWEMPLIASQVVLLATAFTRFKVQWTRHKSDMETAMAFLRTEISSGSYVKRCFDRLLQAAMFADNKIDDRLWLHLGKEISNEASQGRLDEAVRKVAEALERGTLTTREDHYRYMRALLEFVSEYRAICFVESVKVNAAGELEDKNARYFLFNAPIDYSNQKKKLFRLFVLKDPSDFQRFHKSLRENLKQQCNLRKYLQLKWRIAPHPDLNDFGVYGDVAVGRFENNVNVIALDGSAAQKDRRRWETIWDDQESKAVTDAELGL